MVADKYLLSYLRVGRRRCRAGARVRDQESSRQSVGKRGSHVAPPDLGIILPTYTFATPVFGGQATVGVLGSYGVVSTSLAGTLAGALSVPPFGSLPFSRSTASAIRCGVSAT